jgi:PAS domain S-box-containing protein
LEYLKNEDNGKPCLILLELNMPKMNGIEFIDEVPWGTHLCQFYQSKEDLIEILVPYFKQGLENNEFCMWVTAEPLGVEDAKNALKEKVKNLDDYIRKGQIEILDYNQWYTTTGRFEADKVIEGWVEKEKQAIEKGFDGLRLTGNTFWLEKKDWQSFVDYEAVVNSVIGKHRMLAICSYSLDRCQAGEVIDVVNNHQFALIRKEGKWTTLESSERRRAQVKLQQHIKQLDCLYGLSRIAVQPQISLDQIFRETAELVRSTYRYPDITCIRVTFNGIQYKTDNFQKTEHSQWGDILVRGEKAGSIEVYRFEERREDKEGSFLKEEGALLGAVCEKLGRIAELKQATDKLRLFRTLIDQSNDCIFILEPKWGRFLDVNDRACESLGYSRKELLEMSIKDIEEFPDDSSWQQQVEELKLKGDIVIQGRHKCKDGTRFFAETSLKFVKEEKEDYIIAIARDITERKKAENRQTELIKEVENVNRELKDFAYIVSHDLKAPLRGIKTLASWLSADYGDKFDELGKEQMKLLSGRVDRMYNLINGILEYSRIGRLQENRAIVDLNKLVPEIIDTIAPPENITITVENELPTIECEPTRITQVFQNLLSNAVKYMDKPQGQIKVGCVEENGFWKFNVTDNGPGIEERHFERIFQMFQTLAPRDDFESTGIGLTITKKIVELYGGRIWVQSKVRQGCTFFFTLPKQKVGVEGAKLEANIAY